MGTKSPRVLFFSANGMDGIASQTATILIQLILVNQLGFSGSQLGVLNALPMLITILLSVVAGTVVDHLPIHRILLLSVGSSALLMGAFAALYLTGGLSFPAVLALEVLLTTCGVFANNAQLVGASHLQRTTPGSQLVARIASTDQFTRILAPIITLPIVTYEIYGAGLVGAAVAATLAAVLLLPLGGALRREEAEPGTAEDKPPGEGKKKLLPLAGIQALRAERTLWAAVLLIVFSNFGLAFGDLATTLLLLRELQFSEQSYMLRGLLGAVGGLGMSFLMARLSRALSFRTLMVLSSGGQLLTIGIYLAMAWWQLDLFLLAAAAAINWTMAIVMINVAAMDYIASHLPEQHTGKAFGALRSLAMGIVPLGALAGGWLVDVMGYLPPLVLWLVSAAVGLGIALLRVRAGELINPEAAHAGTAAATAPLPENTEGPGRE